MNQVATAYQQQGEEIASRRPLLERDVLAWAREMGDASATFWRLPDLTRPDMVEIGRILGVMERRVCWWIGDWYIQAEARFGGMRELTEEAGLNYSSCRNAASCCRAFPMSRRRDDVSFSHHMVVAPLPDDEQDELLHWCVDGEESRSVQQLRTRIQQRRRAMKEAELGAKQIAQADGAKVYGVLYADPPWRLEPYSRETGLNRAADNHYPTMDLEAICACLETFGVQVANDAVLFLWATVPMLQEAMQVMPRWGFQYKSHCVWLKPHAGTGYWFRNQHELLLVGTRGNVPAPAPGEQFASVIEAAVLRHSAKPNIFAEMIEEMFPNLPALELFGRGPRLGWDVLGNEAEAEEAA